MGFPTNKNGHFGAFWGYHHLRKHPYGANIAYIPSNNEMGPYLKGTILVRFKGFHNSLATHQSIKNEMGPYQLNPLSQFLVSRAIRYSG